MRKLELRIDELSVESFETSSATRGRGTVLGNQYGDAITVPDIDDGAETGKQTCGAWHTCGGVETCNYASGCYTFGGGYTCDGASCSPTAPNCPALMY